MEELIVRFGLLAVFIGSAIEGDVTLVLSGVISHLGFANLPLAMALGAAGCFTGDLFWYAAGRFGSGFITGTRAYRAVGPTVERVAWRAGPWQIAISRLIYGTRIATMVFWGVHRLSFARFALIDLLTCAVWAALLGSVGYAVSESAMSIVGRIKRAELWLLGAVVVSAIVFLSIRVAIRTIRRATSGKR